ncbi:MAG: ABA4-like family protein [Polyangiaceae bacterium]
MDLDLVFVVANLSTAPVWLLLLIAPRWKGTNAMAHSVVMPLLLGLAYAVLLFTDMGGDSDANMFTLKGMMAIFDKPQTAIAAWIHYLVFDLFVGAWMVRDAGRKGMSRLLVAPCLVGTWFFGPVGLMTYLGIAGLRGRGWTLREVG